jgi:hypothetical protein
MTAAVSARVRSVLDGRTPAAACFDGVARVWDTAALLGHNQGL